jgi:hypothetical protein
VTASPSSPCHCTPAKEGLDWLDLCLADCREPFALFCATTAPGVHLGPPLHESLSGEASTTPVVLCVRWWARHECSHDHL